MCMYMSTVCYSILCLHSLKIVAYFEWVHARTRPVPHSLCFHPNPLVKCRDEPTRPVWTIRICTIVKMELQIADYLDQPGLCISLLAVILYPIPNSDLQATFPRILPVTQPCWYGSRILEGKCRDIYSHCRCYLAYCCFIFDYPFSGVSLRQTPNHMPRLDCPSVSAETPKPLNPSTPKPLNP